MENIVEKNEVTYFEHLHLFPQYFPKSVFFNVSKLVYTGETVNTEHTENLPLEKVSTVISLR